MNLDKKGLTVAVILLFIGVAITSSINAEMNNTISKPLPTSPRMDDNVSFEFLGTMGDNGWYVSDVTIICVWNTSVVQSVYYSFNGVDFELYTNPIIIYDDGIYEFFYYYVDIYGNMCPVCGPLDLKIDQTPPNIDLIVEGSGEIWTLIAEVDDETSGVAKVEFFVNDELIGVVTEPPYELTYDNASYDDIAQAIVYDNAGNSKISDCPPPPPPPPSFPITLIGKISNLEVHNESTSFHVDFVLSIFIIIPFGILINEDMTIDNEYRGFIGDRFICALFWT